MTKKSIYVCLGPQIGQLTGQAKAFECFISNTTLDIEVINFGGLGINLTRKLMYPLTGFARFIYMLIKYKVIGFYFTPSRSLFGFLRELPFMLLARLLNIPIFPHLHGLDLLDFYRSQHSSVKSLLRYAYKNCFPIVLFKEMSSQFKFTSFSNICVCSNFYDLGKPAESSVFFESNKIKVAFLSNLMPEKGLHILLDAIEGFEPFLMENFEFVVAGDFLEPDYRQQIYNHMSVNKVKLVGKLNKSESAKLLADADIFVFCSIHPTECYPLVLLEAAVSKNVVITPRLNYIPLLFEDYEFIFYETGDKNSLINVFEKLRSLQNLTDIQAKNYEAAKNFSVINYITCLDDFLMNNKK